MIKDIEKQKRIKALRDEIRKGKMDEDGIRSYLIQLENLLPKPTKTLYIDADSLIYYTAYSPTNINSYPPIEGGSFVGNKVEVSLKTAYDEAVADVAQQCRFHSLLGDMITFKDYVLVYTPSTNFRYDLFPEYKKSRLNKEESEGLTKLKREVKPLGLIEEGVEADDVVAHHARRGHPVASGDKDVIFGVEGNHYFYHSAHRKVVKTTKEAAERFVLLQTLAGDSSDDIPGIKGVGMKTKLLPDNATFDDVVGIYESKGLTKDDAILTRRLVGLDQWKGSRRGLKIWQYN